VYRNRFYEPPGVGSHIYFHYYKENDVAPYRHADIFIYHNSFAGGRAGISLSGYADECGGLPKCLVLNNIISSEVSLYAAMTFITEEGMFGALDYNWLGGRFKTTNPGHDYTRAPWYGKKNIFAQGAKIWDDSKMPTFRIPQGNQVLHAGLNLSQTFSANGRSYEALPGMTPDHSSGPRPDLGAVQSR